MAVFICRVIGRENISRPNLREFSHREETQIFLEVELNTLISCTQSIPWVRPTIDLSLNFSSYVFMKN